jgi:hypothetical protein
MAYELLNEDPAKKDYLYENEEFWKYRPIVTFELMTIELNLTTNPEHFKLLKKFTSTVNIKFYFLKINKFLCI